jgi:glyoxylase-like metal-dependent hydrolase (beta-lactamase superfamily II)
VSSATLATTLEHMRVEVVGPGLWYWTGLHPGWTPESGWEQEVGSVYYEAADAVVLIDPLVPPEDEERFLLALDRDVERLGRQVVVVLTAPWHARSTDAIVARYGASLWAHPAGRSRLGRAIDAAVLPKGVEVFEIPPSDEGQVALFLPGHRALVTSEVLAGADGQLRVDASPQLKDRSRLLSCLRLLLELPIDVVLPAHGRPILERGGEAAARAVTHWAPSAA